MIKLLAKIFSRMFGLAEEDETKLYVINERKPANGVEFKLSGTFLFNSENGIPTVYAENVEIISTCPDGYQFLIDAQDVAIKIAMVAMLESALVKTANTASCYKNIAPIADVLSCTRTIN